MCKPAEVFADDEEVGELGVCDVKVFHNGFGFCLADCELQARFLARFWSSLCFDIQCIRLYDSFTGSGGSLVTYID